MWTDKYKGTVHALFEGTDPGFIVALGFISVEFPKFVGTTVKVPNHAGFFRFGVRGSIARSGVRSWNTSNSYICIRQVIEISTIVRKHARICASACVSLSPVMFISEVSSPPPDPVIIVSGCDRKTKWMTDLQPVPVRQLDVLRR